MRWWGFGMRNIFYPLVTGQVEPIHLTNICEKIVKIIDKSNIKADFFKLYESREDGRKNFFLVIKCKLKRINSVDIAKIPWYL